MNKVFNLYAIKNNFEKYSHVYSNVLLDFCKDDFIPAVTIAIPTFKRPHLLKEAIDSAANQSSTIAYEIIVVDNDAESEFETKILDIIAKYKHCNIKYYKNAQNIGMFGNWNRCIELSKGKKISLLNDDDVLHPDWLLAMENYLSEDLVKVKFQKFTHASELNFSSKQRKIRTNKIKFINCFFGHICPGSLGMMLDKQKCIDIGGFNENLFPTADYDFVCRYIHKFSAIRLNQTLAYYRWAENESMKPEVTEGFAINDFNMRKSFFNKEFLNFDLINKILTIKYIDDIKSNDAKINDQMLFNKINATKFEHKIASLLKIKIFRKLLRNYIYVSHSIMSLFK